MTIGVIISFESCFIDKLYINDSTKLHNIKILAGEKVRNTEPDTSVPCRTDHGLKSKSTTELVPENARRHRGRPRFGSHSPKAGMNVNYSIPPGF